jgi:hypothetical protein
VVNFFLQLQNNTQKILFTNPSANGRAIFTICGLKGNWIWADGMLHRCAFDARSSEALSAHPWNLPYHSQENFSLEELSQVRLLFHLKPTSSLANGVRTLSFPWGSCFPKTTARNKTQHHPLDFPCNIFFSILLFFFGKSRRKKLGVPFSNGSENFFGKNETGYKK